MSFQYISSSFSSSPSHISPYIRESDPHCFSHVKVKSSTKSEKTSTVHSAEEQNKKNFEMLETVRKCTSTQIFAPLNTTPKIDEEYGLPQSIAQHNQKDSFSPLPKPSAPQVQVTMVSKACIMNEEGIPRCHATPLFHLSLLPLSLNAHDKDVNRVIISKTPPVNLEQEIPKTTVDLTFGSRFNKDKSTLPRKVIISKTPPADFEKDKACEKKEQPDSNYSKPSSKPHIPKLTFPETILGSPLEGEDCKRSKSDIPKLYMPKY